MIDSDSDTTKTAHQRFYEHMFKGLTMKPTPKRIIYGIHAVETLLRTNENALGYKFNPDNWPPQGISARKDYFNFDEVMLSDEDNGDDASIDSGGPDNGNYNPNEPRVPAGSPEGGQWATGGVLTAPDRSPIIDPNTNDAYPAPPGLNIRRNTEKGATANVIDLYRWFSHGGAMDYQRTSGTFNIQYRNVTNYNYGAVMASAGYSLDATLSDAGLYNRYFGRITPQDTNYDIRSDAVRNITQGWNDFFSIWRK